MITDFAIGTCNMAIMSYAASPLMHISLGLSSWRNVKWNGDSLINRCIYMGPTEGGRVIVPNCTSSANICVKFDIPFICTNRSPSVAGALPVLSLFLWESGSYFDFVCNELQNDPSSITPTMMSLMTATNGTLAQNSTFPKTLASLPMSSASAAARIQAIRDRAATS